MIWRRLQMGQEYARKKLKRNFERALRLYSGDHYKNTRQVSPTARICINYTMHVIETRTQGVAFRYPRFVLSPGDDQAQQNEAMVQAWLKDSWTAGYIQEELRACKKDSEIYGFGVVQTGWLFETEDGAIVDDGSREGARRVRQDRFFAQRMFPGNFLISPEAGRCFRRAQWCGYWEIVPLEEVKANPHFANTRQLKGNADNLKNFLDPEQRQKNDYPDDIKRVKLFHYFERARRIHVVMCDEHEKVLYAGKWLFDRYPFRYLQGPGDEDTPYGNSKALMIEHPQKEINEARSQLSDYRKAAVPKLQGGPGVLSEKGRTELKSDIPLAFVEHTSDAPSSIAPIQIPQIQPEVYSTEDKSLSDIQAISAISQYEVGRPPSKRTPGIEVQAIQSLGGARAQNDLQAFEQLCAEVAQDCIEWGQKYALQSRLLPVIPKGQKSPVFLDVGRETITGKYQVEVAAHSTAAPNDADRLQSVAFFIQSINPLIQLLPVAMQYGINLAPLFRQILRALPDIQDVDEILEGLTRGQGLSGDASTSSQPAQNPLSYLNTGPLGAPQDLLAALEAGGV